jgi:glutamate carboxypeptidase
MPKEKTMAAADSATTSLKGQEAQICAWLAEQHGPMMALLEDVVNIDSGSYDKAGVDQVGDRFIRHYNERGMLTKVEPHETFGNAIHIRLDDSLSNEKPIVLMGHRDTVFPKGEVAKRKFKIEGTRAYGPGVADMKGQAAIWVDTLIRFKQEGFKPKRTVKIALTCGEETAGAFTGAEYLATHHRDLIDAEFA